MLVADDIVAQHPQQHRAIDLVGRVQPSLRHRVQPGDEALLRLDLGIARGQRQVGNLVVIVAHAARRRLHRMDREIPFPVIVDHLGQLVMGSLGVSQSGRRNGEHQGNDLAHGRN